MPICNEYFTIQHKHSTVEGKVFVVSFMSASSDMRNQTGSSHITLLSTCDVISDGLLRMHYTIPEAECFCYSGNAEFTEISELMVLPVGRCDFQDDMLAETWRVVAQLRTPLVDYKSLISFKM